jgi:hypothetical protein
MPTRVPCRRIEQWRQKNKKNDIRVKHDRGKMRDEANHQANQHKGNGEWEANFLTENGKKCYAEKQKHDDGDIFHRVFLKKTVAI